jgi:very-short-patch-repair endonuclease
VRCVTEPGDGRCSSVYMQKGSREGWRDAVYRKAGRQHGLITRAQVRVLGMSAGAISNRLNSDEWTRIYDGIYLVRPFSMTEDAALLAAILRAGDGAVASHRAAAAKLGLDGGFLPCVELYSHRWLRSHNGLVIHRTNDLPKRDILRLGPIPVTNATRTLIDLGNVVDAATLEIALESALHKRLTSIQKLDRRLDELAGRGRRGTLAIRRLLEQRDPNLAAAASRLEIEFHNLARRGRLPVAVRQLEVVIPSGRRRYIDFAYPEHLLGIEVGGRGWHTGPVAERRDSVRHNELTAMGWRILYFSWTDVVHRAPYVLEAIRSEVKRNI